MSSSPPSSPLVMLAVMAAILGRSIRGVRPGGDVAIDRRMDLDPERFLEEYYRPGRPVLLAHSGARSRAAWRAQLDAILAGWGQAGASSSSSPSAEGANGGGRRAVHGCTSERAAQNRCAEEGEVVSLENFFEGTLQQELWANEGTDAPLGMIRATRWTHPNLHGRAPALLRRRATNRTVFEQLREARGSGAGTGARARGVWQHVALPDIDLVPFRDVVGRLTMPLDPRAPFRKAQSPSQQQMDFLSLGVAGTGADFHRHGKAFAWLLHGAKQWFLMDPETSVAAASRIWRRCDGRAAARSQEFLARVGARACRTWDEEEREEEDGGATHGPSRGSGRGRAGEEGEDEEAGPGGNEERQQWAACQVEAAVVMKRALPVAERVRSAALAACLADGAGAVEAGALASLPLLTCTQRSGDLLFIPAGFFHATINHGDTVGLSRVATKGEAGCQDRCLAAATQENHGFDDDEAARGGAALANAQEETALDASLKRLADHAFVGQTFTRSMVQPRLELLRGLSEASRDGDGGADKGGGPASSTASPPDTRERSSPWLKPWT